MGLLRVRLAELRLKKRHSAFSGQLFVVLYVGLGTIVVLTVQVLSGCRELSEWAIGAITLLGPLGFWGVGRLIDWWVPPTPYWSTADGIAIQELEMMIEAGMDDK